MDNHDITYLLKNVIGMSGTEYKAAFNKLDYLRGIDDIMKQIY